MYIFICLLGTYISMRILYKITVISYKKQQLYLMSLKKLMVKEYLQRILHSLSMVKQSKVQHQMRLQRLLLKTQEIKDYTLHLNKSLSQGKLSLELPLGLTQQFRSIVRTQYKIFNNY